MTKLCTKCKIEKNRAEFYKDKRSKVGLESWCKSCVKSHHKQYYQDNNKELKANKKQYWLDNKEQLKADHKQYQADRRVSDPLYKLINNLRCLLGHSIKRGGYKKNTKTQELLGASFDTVMAHFQVSWLQRHSNPLPDKFEIHHIIENHTATTEKELIKLQHYTNLMPVSYEEHKELHGV